jgi:hypothetical protein
MPLNAQISLSIIAHESTSGDISRQMRVTPAIYAAMLTDGTGANQAQVVWSTTEAIGDSGGIDLVLAALQDDRGTVSFTALKAIYVRNVGSGQLGVSAVSWSDPPFSGAINLESGSVLAFVYPSAAGWPTTSNGAKLEIINNTEPTTTVEVVFIGEGTIT